MPCFKNSPFLFFLITMTDIIQFYKDLACNFLRKLAVSICNFVYLTLNCTYMILWNLHVLFQQFTTVCHKCQWLNAFNAVMQHATSNAEQLLKWPACSRTQALSLLHYWSIALSTTLWKPTHVLINPYHMLCHVLHWPLVDLFLHH